MIVSAALLMLAQANGAQAVDECADPQTEGQMNVCAARDFAVADAALNEQWQLTAARMKTFDAEIDREHDNVPGYFDTLLESQRAWLAFRDAHCRMESFMARGGSTQPLLDAHCKTYMTGLRIEQLRNLGATP